MHVCTKSRVVSTFEVDKNIVSGIVAEFVLTIKKAFVKTETMLVAVIENCTSIYKWFVAWLLVVGDDRSLFRVLDYCPKR